MKAVLRDRIFLEVNSTLKDHVIKNLTYTIPMKMGMTEIRYVKLYDYKIVNEKTMSIPIGRTDLIPSTHDIIDKRTYNMVDFHLREGITLRDSQQAIYNSCEDNCIVNAGCSFGKTFTALALIEKLGQKTIVIVHTKKLQDQWVEESKKILGINPGIIGGGLFQLDNDLIIATKQTLDKRADAKLYNEFGTVVIDEAHHTAARTFNVILDKFRARYKIGLSATLKRKDMKEFLITNYLTKTNIYKPKTENSMTPSVIAIRSGILLPGAASWQGRVTKLLENTDYSSIILDIVNNQVDKGHKVLVIANRVEFLKNMSNVLDKSELIIGGSEDTADVIKRVYSGETTTILGSTQVMSEGISVNPLSCLILATPINSDILLEQVIGRVIRECANKNSPVIFDIILKGQTGSNQWRTRKQHYIKMGYEIDEIIL